MSLQSPMTWAWKQQVDALTRLVLLALADMADEDGIVWDAPYRVLSEKTALNVETIGRRIRFLGDIGSIQHASGDAYRVMIREAS